MTDNHPPTAAPRDNKTPCPHCARPIPGEVIVCPFCDEAVRQSLTGPIGKKERPAWFAMNVVPTTLASLGVTYFVLLALSTLGMMLDFRVEMFAIFGFLWLFLPGCGLVCTCIRTRFTGEKFNKEAAMIGALEFTGCFIVVAFATSVIFLVLSSVTRW